MPPRNSNVRPKPQPGIYDGLLVVSTAALILGITFLALHLGHYNWVVVP